MLSLATFLFAVSAADSHSHFLDALAPSEESLGFVSESLEVEEKRSLLKTSTVKIISISVAVGTVLLSLGGGIGIGYMWGKGGAGAASPSTNFFVLDKYNIGASKKVSLIFTLVGEVPTTSAIFFTSKWDISQGSCATSAAPDAAKITLQAPGRGGAASNLTWRDPVTTALAAGTFVCDLTVTTTVTTVPESKILIRVAPATIVSFDDVLTLDTVATQTITVDFIGPAVVR